MFTDEDVGDLSFEARWLFAGLFTQADREGRLEDRPRKLKVEVMPYDSVNIEHLLHELTEARFILRYEIEGRRFIQIRTFQEHQMPHYKEPGSIIPAPDPKYESATTAGGVPEKVRQAVIRRDKRCQSCGKSDSLSIDHIIPRSSGGSHDIGNLRALCVRCNSRKGKRLASLDQRRVNDGSTLKRRRGKHGYMEKGNGEEGMEKGKGRGREGEGEEEGAREASSKQVKGNNSASASDLFPDSYLDELQADPAYGDLEVRRVTAKMLRWCKDHGKEPTRDRLINWLNREEPRKGNGANDDDRGSSDQAARVAASLSRDN
jgi:hypothetical protein